MADAPNQGRRRPCRVSPTHPDTSRDWQTAGRTPRLPRHIPAQTCTGKGTPRPQGKGMAPEGGSGFNTDRAHTLHAPQPPAHALAAATKQTRSLSAQTGDSRTQECFQPETVGLGLAMHRDRDRAPGRQGWKTPTPMRTHLASGVTAPSAPSQSVPLGKGVAASLPSRQEGG